MKFSSLFRDLSNTSTVRQIILLSFSLQVILVLYAPFRRKTTDRIIVFFLRVCYLMAPSLATFTIGVISQQGNSSVLVGDLESAFQAFWASFLLLHFGGPDNLTSFFLEDNIFWKWHLVNFIVQVGTVIRVFVKIFPSDNTLVIPTIVVFLAAIIKNVERLLALHLSDLPRFREGVFTRHKLIEDDNFRGDLLGDLHSYAEDGGNLGESTVVKHAYCFFQFFKVFLADLIFAHRVYQMSREYFCKVSAMDALRVISVELQFMYGELHTKALIIHSRWSHIFRFIAFIEVAIASAMFNSLKKSRFSELDVLITNILLFGGITLDTLSLCMLVFSDWTVAQMKYNRGLFKLDSFLHMLFCAMDTLRKPKLTKCKIDPNETVTYEVLNTLMIFRTWSESISACNLFSESLKRSPRKIYKHRVITYLYDKCSFTFHQVVETILEVCRLKHPERMIKNTPYMSRSPFVMKLWIFIFREVTSKSQSIDDILELKKIFGARGDLFLQSRLERLDCENLLAYVQTANYDSTILTWHLATEILYNRERELMSSPAANDEMEFSKILSDYMLYLLLNQHDVMSDVAGIAQITAAKMVRKIRGHISEATEDEKGLCKALYEASTGTYDLTSQLQEGIQLAQELEGFRERQWEVMSGVWVEMLSYAASHIKGEAHMRVLSKGGELLTFIWLLMAHLGCCYKPEWGMES
ncbi:hypothetical protein BT93_L2405 [Corymbia citriodora subsp. variegata]|uniref:DUF4220 domain-containing protein n=1 Tax=Corymbia citriodora subsp. variegata TaxID=360336 RepID=A0A8T0CJV5_CORYI|nr:hypothetical protein BT93_L2405 [Corymbia citriodora subsp. variegata]